MTRKLKRDLSTPENREWWRRIEEAAASRDDIRSELIIQMAAENEQLRAAVQQERNFWQNFITGACIYGFKGWWPGDREGDPDLEPWETFLIRLCGVEAADMPDDHDVAQLILEAAERARSKP